MTKVIEQQSLPIHIQEVIDRGCTEMDKLIMNGCIEILANFDQRASDLGYRKVIRRMTWVEDYLTVMNDRLKMDNEYPANNDLWHQNNNLLWFNAYLNAVAMDLGIHRKVSR